MRFSKNLLKQTSGDVRKHLSKKLDFLVARSKIPGGNLRLNIFLAARLFWLNAQKLIPPSKKLYEQGIEIIDVEYERSFPRAKFPNPAYRYFLKNREDHIFETIFFDRNDFLREGNISNVFAVFGKTVVTPEKNILLGVTRARVLQSAADLYPVQEREISKKELLDADEIFITNTTKEIVPVRKWGTWTNENFSVASLLRTRFREQWVL